MDKDMYYLISTILFLLAGVVLMINDFHLGAALFLILGTAEGLMAADSK